DKELEHQQLEFEKQIERKTKEVRTLQKKIEQIQDKHRAEMNRQCTVVETLGKQVEMYRNEAQENERRMRETKEWQEIGEAMKQQLTRHTFKLILADNAKQQYPAFFHERIYSVRELKRMVKDQEGPLHDVLLIDRTLFKTTSEWMELTQQLTKQQRTFEVLIGYGATAHIEQIIAYFAGHKGEESHANSETTTHSE
ncbi:MAG: hypothetical protein ACRC5C_13530, partial [Bacilli bacterium]